MSDEAGTAPKGTPTDAPTEPEELRSDAAAATDDTAADAPAEASADAPGEAAEAAPAAPPVPAPAAATGPDPRENVLVLELTHGKVTVELLPDLAPLHVARIKELARAGFYDGTPFHRVIEGFMAQGGDPTGTGRGGAREKGYADLPAEFTAPGKAKFVRGTCGMARTMDPNSANSQFFIMFAPAPSLDGQYTIWGRVVAGMETVDRIKRGGGANGMVQDPDKLVSAKVAADLPAA